MHRIERHLASGIVDRLVGQRRRPGLRSRVGGAVGASLIWRPCRRGGVRLAALPAVDRDREHFREVTPQLVGCKKSSAEFNPGTILPVAQYPTKPPISTAAVPRYPSAAEEEQASGAVGKCALLSSRWTVYMYICPRSHLFRIA
jgi:hypothetical protein